jgi:thiamine pyrophosphate-dependent acetolactate synthase large subunit-like protein
VQDEPAGPPRERALAGVERPRSPGAPAMAWNSDAVAELLRRLGVPYVALVPGSSFRGLHDSLVNYLGNRDPQLLVTLHEEHAVAIAHGFAKVTGEPMAAAVHANVGLMHATMAIFNAWCDRVPVLVLGATGPVDAARRRPWIDWIHTAQDQGALVRGYTKWDAQPASLPAALEALLRAHLLARTAPGGPVYVCLDVGLQESALAGPAAIPDPARFRPASPPVPPDAAVDQAVELLLAARRPLVLVGRVSRAPDAWARRVGLVERLGADVLTDLKLGAAFPTAHPRHVAPPGFTLSEAALRAVREADVVLSLDWLDLAGTLRQAGGDDARPARVVHASVDLHVHNGWSMDHQGLPAVDVPLLAEPDVAVTALLSALERRDAGRASRPAAPAGDARRGDSAGDALSARDARPGRDAGEAPPADPPGRAAGEAPSTPLPRAAPPGRAAGGIELRDLAVHLGDALRDRPACLVRLPLGWPGEACDFRDPLDYLGGDGGAGVGSGPGMAVGAALALRGTGRLPVAVLGDGDYLMGVTALWTAAHYAIPLLVVVANNRSYGNDEGHQERVARARGRPPENRWIGQRLSDPAVDLAAMARAQGLDAAGPVTDLAALPAALARAVAAAGAGRPYVLDVLVAAGL